MSFPWSALEELRNPAAVSAVWRSMLGEYFERFSAGFLQRTTRKVQSYPCPRDCGCAHEVIEHGTEDIVGVCRCDSWHCDDLMLTAAEITIHELSWNKFGRALCGALSLDFKLADLNLRNTRQIGSWSADAIPAILAIEHTAGEFRRALTSLTARLRQPFILLAPTAGHLEATGKELLAGVGAGFFTLGACLRFTSSGALHSLKTPGELFAQFSPDPKELVSED